MLTKEQIIEELRKDGGRVTKQRRMLLDIIMENECANCKEIYYRASKADKSIGIATVYRMLNKLEEMGVVSREYSYRLKRTKECEEICPKEDRQDEQKNCTIILDDHTVYRLSEKSCNKMLEAGLRKNGYLTDQKVLSVKVE